MRGTWIAGTLALVGCSTTFHPAIDGTPGDDAAPDGPQPGVGVAFDGVDDTLPSTNALALGAIGALTAEHWFRPQAAQQQMTLLGIQGGALVELRADGHFACALFDQTGGRHDAMGTASPRLGEWTHVACSYDGATERLFVDGALDGEVAWTGTVKLADFVTITGKGDLDEFSLSRTARYTAAFAPPRHVAVDADAVVVWFLDEGVGIRSTDASGNGIDATLGLNAASPAWTSFER